MIDPSPSLLIFFRRILCRDLEGDLLSAELPAGQARQSLV
jgi:hypothetical protein